MTPERSNEHLRGRYTILAAALALTGVITAALINRNNAKQAEASLAAAEKSEESLPTKPDSAKPENQRDTIIDPPRGDGPFITQVDVTPLKFGKNGGIAKVTAQIDDPHGVTEVKLIITNASSADRELDMTNGGNGLWYMVEIPFDPLYTSKYQYYKLQIKARCDDGKYTLENVPTVTVENK